MAKKLYEIAAGIVEAQATIGQMGPDTLEQALSRVFTTLQRMKRAEDGGILLEEVKPQSPEEGDPKSSIKEDRVVCLECRKEMRQLTAKHLASHGLSIREYKSKWGFPQRQSLSAISLSKARSKAAKKRGLPEKLVKFQETKRQQKTAGVDAPISVKEVTAPVRKKARTKTSPEKRID